MSVRRAEPADAPAIAAIWNPIIRKTLVTFNSVEKADADIAAMIDGGVPGIFVAETAGSVVGFAFYSQFRGGVGYAHTMEHSIHLLPDARGQGLGRALMRAIETDAKAHGAHTIFAGVSSGNPDGVTFHAAMGFEPVATLKDVGFKWGQWLDLHLMQKHLSPRTDKS